VDRRQQEEDGEQDQKEIGPAQRPGAVPLHAAIPRASARCSGYRLHGAGHHTSLPRRVMSRRMKTAATARIGTMNSDTLAPSGMSPPSMPRRNAQVANTWVESTGPPAVRMRTISKLANVTMSENSAVIAMMLRIIGSVMNQIFCHQLAPSMAAAS